MPADLLSRCNAAASRGETFPAIWQTILQTSFLVKGTPIQASAGRLEVRLINGQRLVYLSDAKEFSLG